MPKEIKFHLSLKSESDKEKPALLYIMLTLDKRYKISAKESVPPNLWDKRNERCFEGNMYTKNENKVAKRINQYVEYLKKELREALDVHIRWKEVRVHPMLGKKMPDFIIRQIRSIIKKYGIEELVEIERKVITPTEYFTDYCKRKKSMVVKDRSTFTNSGTVKHHFIVLKRFKKFLLERGLIDSFRIFGERYESQMETWMLSTMNYSPNTVSATFSIMKVWINDAVNNGIIVPNYYKQWKSKAQDVQHVYLNDDEIKRIYNIELTEDLKKEYKIDFKSNIERTKDLFIVACHLGIRLGDWNKLSKSVWNFNVDEPYVQIHTSKTNETVMIPISPTVKAIYDKYDGKFPTAIDKSHTNKQIQLLSQIAGIDNMEVIKKNVGGKIIEIRKKKYELVSSHTARRSFATNLYLKCKTAKLVMMFTGHKTEDSFFKYICVNKLENVSLMYNYFQ